MSTLKTLKDQCNTLGLKFHHRAGEDKLRALIGAHLVDHPQDARKLYDAPPEAAVVQQQEIDETARAYTKEEIDAVLQRGKKATRKSLSRLRRIRLTCMNPMKREWKGEIISVGSAKHGTWKKYVPFNSKPYHVPQIIYDMLQERQCTIYETIPNADGRGGDIRKGRQIKEFAIEDLPPLTPEELETLAKKQQLASQGL